MLLSLSIRNFVIVDELELEFAPGFSVLTGETGAGKSILIDALLLALGERADADVVREGAARAEISAEFRVGAAARDWLAAQALDGEDTGSALLRRRNGQVLDLTSEVALQPQLQRRDKRVDGGVCIEKRNGQQ